MARIFLFAFIILFSLGSPNLYAANSLFTIENIEIDVTAENAIKAREKAFEEAQVKAFEELTTRMLSEGAEATFQTPAPDQISRLIQDFEVSNEKLSSKRYSGTYKFRFNDNAVKRLFAQTGAPVTDMASSPMLILPFIEKGGRTDLWSPTNAWMRAWNNMDNSGGLVPLVVPIGDLSDVQDMPDEDALTYNPRDLASMLRRYGASEAVIAIAKDSPEGGIAVQLYRTDRGTPEYAHYIRQPLLASQSTDTLYALAVSKVKSALREDWKAKAAVEPQERGSGVLQIRAGFSNLDEWASIRTALSRVYPITDIQIKAMSPREAYIDIRYDGTLSRLQLAMQQSGMILNAPQNIRDQPVLGGFNSTEQNMGGVYDLRFERGPRAGSYAPPRGYNTKPSTYGAQGNGYSAQF